MLVAEPEIIDRSAIVEKLISTDVGALVYARERCKTSLRFLCEKILRYTDWDKCHDEMSQWLSSEMQKTHEGKKIIFMLMPRGHLKSSLITIGFSIQQMLINPDIRILLVNAVWDNARSFLSEISSFLTGKSFLADLFGAFKTDRFNQEEITIAQRVRPNKTPTFSTAGIDSAKASQHYDLVIADDIVNRQNVTSSDLRAKTTLYYKDMLDLLEPKGTLIVIGTRWHDGDLYGEKMREQKVNPDPGMSFYIRKVVENGQFIFPRKFDNGVLEQLKREKGSFEVSAQYFNDPISEEDQQFKPPIRYWANLEEATHYGAFDPATSEKESACEAVVFSGAMNRSNQLLAVEYKVFQKKNPTEMIAQMFEYAQKYQWKKLAVETNGGQEVYVKLIQEEQRKRNVYFEIVPLHHVKDKFSRIIALQPRYESGNLLLKQGMIELEDQLLRFPISSKLDIVDTLAMIQEIAEPNIGVKAKLYVPKEYR